MKVRRGAVLLVVAHPDDESFGPGGTMAKLAARGNAVHMLVATRGEAGTVFHEEMQRPEVLDQLGEVRESEARCAADTLGATGISFLGHPDGGLSEVNAGELAMEVATEIRRVRPAVVVTFGPEGIYGHPDHVAIGAAATEAFELAADETIAIGDLPAHAVDRLFYQVIRAEDAEELNREPGPVMLDGEPHPFVGYSAAEITTRVDATAHSEAKLRALLCHRTQTADRADEMRDWLVGETLIENYVLARSRVAAAEGLDADLLAGL